MPDQKKVFLAQSAGNINYMFDGEGLKCIRISENKWVEYPPLDPKNLEEPIKDCSRKHSLALEHIYQQQVKPEPTRESGMLKDKKQEEAENGKQISVTEEKISIYCLSVHGIPGHFMRVAKHLWLKLDGKEARPVISPSDEWNMIEALFQSNRCDNKPENEKAVITDHGHMDEISCLVYRCPNCEGDNIEEEFSFCPDCGCSIEFKPNMVGK